jgi:hypothetical protein
MNDLELFVESVQQAAELPEFVRQRATEVAALRMQLFDDALLSLLDSQMSLSTRGPEWIDRMARQKKALSPYRNRHLLKGRIQRGLDAFWIYVDPETKNIVYWECYRNWAEQL